MNWISVKEKLPSDDKHILMFVRVYKQQLDIIRRKYKKAYVVTGLYQYDTFFSYDIFNNNQWGLHEHFEVTHWAKIEAPE